jgi:1-acyl-sn-glycerol-3-phosphate acyltransferase
MADIEMLLTIYNFILGRPLQTIIFVKNQKCRPFKSVGLAGRALPVSQGWRLDMNKEEILYNNIPPSLHRSGIDPFIEAKDSFLCKSAFDILLACWMKKIFYSMKIKNKENFQKRNPNAANIFYAQHHCWWDGLIGYYLSRKVLNINLKIMVEELVKFPWLSRLGTFSVDKKSPKSAIKALDYSVEVLKNPNGNIWLFPQGIINPPDHRPIKFANGIAYICEKVKTVNLIPIGIKYVFLRYDRPEILIEIGKPEIIQHEIQDRKLFTKILEENYTKFVDNQIAEISSGKLENYETIFKQKDNLYKKYENFLKNKKKI